MPLAPASPFAALLRRSKFASLDTSIAQVYTTAGGDLSRGNWGLKRPLQLRRKGAYITVKAVDSKEQQTEWDLADQQARWVQMWDEVGVAPALAEGPWQRRLGSNVNVTQEAFDSEYSKGVREAKDDWAEEANVSSTAAQPWEQAQLTEQERVAKEEREALLRMLEEGPGASMPNIYAMSDSEFKNYLAKVRKMRPTFQAYRNLVAEANRRQAQETAWQDLPADHGSTLFKTFLAKSAENDLTAPQSRIIEQQPQQVAGLTYTKSSLLQSQLLSKPHRGRVLMKNKSEEMGRNKGIENLASFAGMVPYLSDALRGDTAGSVDWKKLAEAAVYIPGRETGNFRLVNAKLWTAPTVVGETRSGMKGVMLETDVQALSEEDLDQGRQPGTREYVGKLTKRAARTKALGPTFKTTWMFGSSRVELQQPGQDYVEASSVLNSLQDIISAPSDVDSP
ncbi:mitochondrial ribosomal protein subunit-domain-containing protein [Cytidiella melzeri]|nr:mitochondrial ribosomal protein subunit-domain-containing protein [Cytidiella melzeri]